MQSGYYQYSGLGMPFVALLPSGRSQNQLSESRQRRDEFWFWQSARYRRAKRDSAPGPFAPFGPPKGERQCLAIHNWNLQRTPKKSTRRTHYNYLFFEFVLCVFSYEELLWRRLRDFLWCLIHFLLPPFCYNRLCRILGGLKGGPKSQRREVSFCTACGSFRAEQTCKLNTFLPHPFSMALGCSR